MEKEIDDLVKYAELNLRYNSDIFHTTIAMLNSSGSAGRVNYEKDKYNLENAQTLYDKIRNIQELHRRKESSENLLKLD